MLDDWRGSGDWDDLGDVLAEAPIRSPKPRSNQWTDDEKALMSSLWAQDVTADEIGRRIGRSKNAVLGQRQRQGLPKRTIETYQRAGRRKRRSSRTG